MDIFLLVIIELFLARCFRFVTIHAFDRRTDRQTDGQMLVGKTALHTMQRGKNERDRKIQNIVLSSRRYGQTRIALYEIVYWSSNKKQKNLLSDGCSCLLLRPLYTNNRMSRWPSQCANGCKLRLRV